eukprot:gnl/TRDRNA2_/TRDRNA2_39479_c0_seq1.p2 gnl/TRDRNA2_/TRDRNA2_39479_c0~~gnl/TRDRNA2_/TRDRNA2_39479_c0_seq1.p2  ORF type:complete len:144 (+),score=14.70 gnl/TRDRNA2_/TRDRNA2_39479_c0_seq1:29-460(+)
MWSCGAAVATAALMLLPGCSANNRGASTRCPGTVRPGDNSASCTRYCQARGYIAGMMVGGGSDTCGPSRTPGELWGLDEDQCTCRCRAFVPLSQACDADVVKGGERVLSHDRGCDYDVCSVPNFHNKDLLAPEGGGHSSHEEL